MKKIFYLLYIEFECSQRYFYHRCVFKINQITRCALVMALTCVFLSPAFADPLDDFEGSWGVISPEKYLGEGIFVYRRGITLKAVMMDPFDKVSITPLAQADGIADFILSGSKDGADFKCYYGLLWFDQNNFAWSLKHGPVICYAVGSLKLQRIPNNNSSSNSSGKDKNEPLQEKLSNEPRIEFDSYPEDVLGSQVPVYFDDRSPVKIKSKEVYIPIGEHRRVCLDVPDDVGHFTIFRSGIKTMPGVSNGDPTILERGCYWSNTNNKSITCQSYEIEIFELIKEQDGKYSLCSQVANPAWMHAIVYLEIEGYR